MPSARIRVIATAAAPHLHLPKIAKGKQSDLPAALLYTRETVFDDGTTRPFFQLPLATFANPDGLAAISGNAYYASSESGVAAIGKPGTLGAGSIKASSLEASNVDLAEEFSNMIRFQRAYSASSRIITTADEMLQEVVNLKR